MIIHLLHNEINKVKWDTCVNNALNNKVYAQAWYLDIVSPQWEALVEDDYNKVMPLPVKYKYGINYLMQPILCQQLGVYGIINSQEDIIRFIWAIPSKYIYWHFNLNDLNPLLANADFKLISNANYELNLNKYYSYFYKKYSTNCIRNIKKTHETGLYMNYNKSVTDFITFIKKHSTLKFNCNNIATMQKLINAAILNESGQIWAVERNNETLSMTFVIFWGNRAYYLASVATDAGKEARALFFMVDSFIKLNAGKELILDFEGSNNAGIAKFFKGFGAFENQYLSVKYNKLPWLLRLFKM